MGLSAEERLIKVLHSLWGYPLPGVLEIEHSGTVLYLVARAKAVLRTWYMSVILLSGSVGLVISFISSRVVIISSTLLSMLSTTSDASSGLYRRMKDARAHQLHEVSFPHLNQLVLAINPL